MAKSASYVREQMSEPAANQRMISSLQWTVWQYQQHLLKHPDTTDMWWFLVDPSAMPPGERPEWAR